MKRIALITLLLLGCNEHAVDECLPLCQSNARRQLEFDECVAFGSDDCRAGNRMCCALDVGCVGELGDQVVVGPEQCLAIITAVCLPACTEENQMAFQRCLGSLDFCAAGPVEGCCAELEGCHGTLGNVTVFGVDGDCCDYDEDCLRGEYCDLSEHRCAEAGCDDDEDCPSELVCDDGECICEDEGHRCDPGEYCVDGECTDDPCELCLDDERCDPVTFACLPCASADLTCNGLDDDCDGTTDEDCVPDVCGNHLVDGLEVQEDCDGPNLDGVDCVMLGFDGGMLECFSDCTFDVGLCTCDQDTDGDGDCDSHDCAPMDATRGRFEREVCDGSQVDEDCDGTIDETFEADVDCDDGTFCNGFEFCGSRGTCETGSPPCDDLLQCTDNVCEEVTGTCSHPNSSVDTTCFDSLGLPSFCDGDGMCIEAG